MAGGCKTDEYLLAIVKGKMIKNNTKRVTAIDAAKTTHNRLNLSSLFKDKSYFCLFFFSNEINFFFTYMATFSYTKNLPILKYCLFSSLYIYF